MVPLRRLIGAATLSEAQQATAEIIDYALTGGSAVCDDGAELVDVIAEIGDLSAHPFRAYFLWILVLMRRWIGVWQRAAMSANPGPRALAAAARERDTASRLEIAGRGLAELVYDSDPETRSMMYRLIGSALPSEEAIEMLIGPISREDNGLATACGLEAAAIALAGIWPNVPIRHIEWLRQSIATGGWEARGRMRHLLDGHAVVELGGPIRLMARQLLDGNTDDLPPEGPFWPAESI
jgi:hypothetical protein